MVEIRSVKLRKIHPRGDVALICGDLVAILGIIFIIGSSFWHHFFKWWVFLVDEDNIPKVWVGLLVFIMGVCLIGGSFFVSTGDPAHKLFNDLMQLIMIVPGGLAIIAGVVIVLLRKTPDIWM